MYRKIESALGDYVDGQQKRYDLECCRRIRPATGWTSFDTKENCVNTWQLKYLPPEVRQSSR